LTLLILAFAPGIFFCLYVYHRDRYEKENPWTVLRVFFLGMASVVPAAALEAWIAPQPEDVMMSGSRLLALIFVLVIGPVEELCKFVPVRFGVYRSREFNEPMDGLVYSTASSMGFASLENLFFLWKEGLAAAPVRALLAIPGHLFFSGIWGYHLGMSRVRSRPGAVTVSVIAASLMHGLYDFLVLSQTELASLSVPLMVGLAYGFLREIDVALQESPWKPEPPDGKKDCAEPVVDCPSCGAPTPANSDKCHQCGLFLPPEGCDEAGRDEGLSG